MRGDASMMHDTCMMHDDSSVDERWGTNRHLFVYFGELGFIGYPSWTPSLMLRGRR